MEIPQHLKLLYRHWAKHTSQVQNKSSIIPPENLLWFIKERMRIWEKKNSGSTPPYTTDVVLNKYRFCNIYRELDRQTIEIHEQLNSLRSDFPLWLLNIAFHRFICKPTTVKNIGLLSFDKQKNIEIYKRLLLLTSPKYGTPYVFPISVIQRSDYPTREQFFCFYLPKAIPQMAEVISKFKNKTVNQALKEILPLFNFNFKFHWTEILIDVAYQYPELIDLYHDFYIGPGALPTARLLDLNMPPTVLVDRITEYKPKGFPFLTLNSKPVTLSAENWEGIFCEYRKYTNLKSGNGRVRRFN